MWGCNMPWSIFEGEDFVASVEYNLEDAVEDELMDFYFLFFILGH